MRLCLLALGGALLPAGCLPDPESEDKPEDTGCTFPTTWYADADGDGYGDDAGALEACVAPAGYVAEGGDCAPEDPEACPGATERCDGVDEDCDGVVDDDATDPESWLPDADGDGYPNRWADLVWACEAPEGYLSSSSDSGSGDCDDADASVHPEGAELCGDGLDNDCSGLLDCEEDVCAVGATCTELDCGDGGDSDGDGLVDCADDDCWGAGCGGPAVRVSGGRMRTVIDDISSSTSGRVSEDWCARDLRQRRATGTASSVTGTLAVPTSDGLAVDTCAWSVSRATLVRRRTSYEGFPGYRLYGHTTSGDATARCVRTDHTSWSASTDTFTREGFTIEPGCGYTSEAILPAVLERPVFSQHSWTRDGLPWYAGEAEVLSSLYRGGPRFTSFEMGSHFGSFETVEFESWVIEDLEGGWIPLP